jgi:hypothetical protein
MRKVRPPDDLVAVSVEVEVGAQIGQRSASLACSEDDLDQSTLGAM